MLALAVLNLAASIITLALACFIFTPLESLRMLHSLVYMCTPDLLPIYHPLPFLPSFICFRHLQLIISKCGHCKHSILVANLQTFKLACFSLTAIESALCM